MKRIVPALLSMLSLAVALLFAEALLRHLDGFAVASLELEEAGTEKSFDSITAAEPHLARIPLAPQARREWFFEEPARPRANEAADPELLRLENAWQRGEVVRFELHKLWNENLVREYGCGDLSPNFPAFPFSRVFTFTPRDGRPHPRYRFIPDRVTPMGLRVNGQGWRGGSIALAKPERTIRIAFLGASTTVSRHEYPRSYPEFVGHWLNVWARERGLDLRFEALNTGREGIDSRDIAAVVRGELLALDPDLAVYYEGSNQFDPNPLLRFPSGEEAVRRTGLEAAARFAKGPLGAFTGHSALARRVDSLLRSFDPEAAVERSKPEYEFTWPAGVDETDPDLASLELPVNLPTILADLERIRADLAGAGAPLVMSSFLWLVEDGMRLDPVRHRSIHDYLNIGFFPARYRDMARLAAFQNRVFRSYARRHGLHFIDVAGTMPAEPDLFVDAIHNSYAGVRLRAWVVFQQLLPLVDAMIADGRLPRAPKAGLPRPWTGTDAVRTLRMNCRSREIEAAPELPAEGWSPSDARTTLSQGWGGTVDVTTDAGASHYSAEMALPPVESGVPYRYRVRLSGAAGTTILVTVLSEDRSRFRTQCELRFDGSGAVGTTILVTVPAGDRSRFRAQCELRFDGSDVADVQLLLTAAEAERPWLLITKGAQAGKTSYRIHSTKRVVDRREPIEVVGDGVLVPRP